MIRYIKKYLAVRSYMHRLSGELARRFDQKSYYPVEIVTQAAQRGGLSSAFIAYAHAAFCTEKDFDAYYEPLQVVCNYHDLRQTIAKRYFSGQLGFDAKMIIARFDRGGFGGGSFYESGIGSQGGGHY